MKDKIWLFFIIGYILLVMIMCSPYVRDYMTHKIEARHGIEISIPNVDRVPLGEFTATAYCGCKVCCGKWTGHKTASGTIPTEGRTAGTDWSVLPQGIDVYVEGVGFRTVEDKTAEWINDRYDGRIIDVYFHSHEDAIKFGKRKAKVYRCLH